MTSSSVQLFNNENNDMSSSMSNSSSSSMNISTNTASINNIASHICLPHDEWFLVPSYPPGSIIQYYFYPGIYSFGIVIDYDLNPKKLHNPPTHLLVRPCFPLLTNHSHPRHSIPFVNIIGEWKKETQTIIERKMNEREEEDLKQQQLNESEQYEKEIMKNKIESSLLHYGSDIGFWVDLISAREYIYKTYKYSIRKSLDDEGKEADNVTSLLKEIQKSDERAYFKQLVNQLPVYYLKRGGDDQKRMQRLGCHNFIMYVSLMAQKHAPKGKLYHWIKTMVRCYFNPDEEKSLTKQLGWPDDAPIPLIPYHYYMKGDDLQMKMYTHDILDFCLGKWMEILLLLLPSHLTGLPEHLQTKTNFHESQINSYSTPSSLNN